MTLSTVPVAGAAWVCVGPAASASAVTAPASAAIVLRQIRQNLRQPIAVGEQTLVATASIGVATAFVGDVDWQVREARFTRGTIDVLWICGLPYVWNWQDTPAAVELLAAPATAPHPGIPSIIVTVSNNIEGIQ
jgi:hypothetical protein